MLEIIKDTLLKLLAFFSTLSLAQLGLLSAVCLVIMTVAFYQGQRKGLRLQSKNRIKSKPEVPSNKIIIAFQIEGIFARYSDRLLPGYLPLGCDSEKNYLIKTLLAFIGIGHYYRPLLSKNKASQFIMNLKSLERVQLFIYSRLEQKIAVSILQKMQLDNFFPEENRIYISSRSENLKHAIEVDQETRRVLIVTSDKCDHLPQDQQYFLLMRIKNRDKANSTLKSYANWLRLIVNNNQDLDYLHEELSHMKVDVQSCAESD